MQINQKTIIDRIRFIVEIEKFVITWSSSWYEAKRRRVEFLGHIIRMDKIKLK